MKRKKISRFAKKKATFRRKSIEARIIILGWYLMPCLGIGSTVVSWMIHEKLKETKQQVVLLEQEVESLQYDLKYCEEGAKELKFENQILEKNGQK